jgi:UDP-2,3-diacylglucosamine pyrophosphatase LpxH
MRRTGSRWVIPTLVAGMAVGGGIAIARTMRAQRHPDQMVAQLLINRALSNTLAKARKQGSIPHDAGRYVLFSDHHKGAGSKADNFRQCKKTYQTALDHYHAEGYTLIVMGDAEELWEEDIEDVMQEHGDILESESRFYPERYIRIHGNHDDAWTSQKRVEQYLYPYFPGIEFRDGLIFDFHDERGFHGEILLVHGHQGTIDSDLLAFMGKLSLPLYRELQNLTGWGETTAAQDACLRAEHDSQMYRWASKQEKLLLIAGHTHRPVWSSRTHLEKLLWQLYQLQQLTFQERPPDYDEQLAQLQADIKRRERKYPPCRDMIKTSPCYFNTGCCRFDDGDITGIELDAGRIRLIKWGEEDGRIARKELEAAGLSEIFVFL